MPSARLTGSALNCSTSRPSGAMTRVVRSCSDAFEVALLPIATMNTIRIRNSRPKNTRLRMSRRVKFITSHSPMKKLATGLRRTGWFMGKTPIGFLP
ncbi:hypothetical protein D3C71_1654060 [compost metagenome]